RTVPASSLRRVIDRNAMTVPIDVDRSRSSCALATATVTDSIGSGCCPAAALALRIDEYFHAASAPAVATSTTIRTTAPIQPRRLIAEVLRSSPPGVSLHFLLCGGSSRLHGTHGVQGRCHRSNGARYVKNSWHDCLPLFRDETKCSGLEPLRHLGRPGRVLIPRHPDPRTMRQSHSVLGPWTHAAESVTPPSPRRRSQP